ncbi:kinesin-4 [Dorcoceras hygrometricum]|uniref:Kinesin-4 n=1 Tax=Dorcoceras hygrometricum TaxID=472368 RepID=A0A2Z7DA37_9LAMI|nr:kinesin-4 [Dorcoceras hygrometricum]
MLAAVYALRIVYDYVLNIAFVAYTHSSLELRSVVAVPCFCLFCAYQDAVEAERVTLVPHLPAGICYYGYSAGHGVDPAGGAPGGDSFSVPPPDTVAEEPVVNISTYLADFQHHPDANSYSSTSVQIDFVNEETADAQTSMPTAIVSSIDYTDAFAHLKASVDQISFEQVAALVHNDILRKGMQALIAALSQELNVVRKEVQDQRAALSNDMMELRVQAQENYNTLTAQLSKVVAYINRGGDAKKGEMSSSRGPPPPDDQSRPSGGGSRSEPQIKRGSGSYRGRGRMRYWLGES